MNKLLTETEVLELLQIEKVTLETYKSKKGFPSTHKRIINRYYKTEEVLKWIKNRRNNETKSN